MKYLSLWRVSPMAPWSAERDEVLKLYEMNFAVVDNELKTCEAKEFGFFPGGKSGYVIAEGDSEDICRRHSHFIPSLRAFSFHPFIKGEVYEMVPLEVGEEVMRGL